jgi:hypothetical protein
MTLEQEKKVRISAAALIVAAAEKSGLLREVAEALCFFDKHRGDVIPCACDGPDALLDALADAFDDHICESAIVVESFFGEGIDVIVNDAEVAPYL